MLKRGGFLELRSSPLLPGSSGLILLSSCAIFIITSQYKCFFKIKFSKITIISHYALLKLHRSTFLQVYKTFLFLVALCALLCLHNQSTPIAMRGNPRVCRAFRRNPFLLFPLQNQLLLLFVLYSSLRKSQKNLPLLREFFVSQGLLYPHLFF